MTLRIVAESDYHCGSVAGLSSDPVNDLQRELLRRHEQCRRDFGRPDVLLVVGDAIDGPQRKGMSGDLTQPDLLDQQRDAAALIESWRAKRVYIISGSGYHVRDDARNDHEAGIAARLRDKGVKAEYCQLLRRKVNGWFGLSARHFIGTTQALNSSQTSIERKRVWELLWSTLAGSERLHLSIFGHRHRWSYAEDQLGASMVLPGWQAVGGSFGALKCDSLITVGSVLIEVANKESGGWSWQKRVWPAVAGAEQLASL